MIGDIMHDRFGWFFRDNGDGTYDNLSGRGHGMAQPTVVLVRNGEITGNGDKLAARVAVVLARRYA